MKHSLLSDALSTINNGEEVGKKDCLIPASDLVLSVLKSLQQEDYIGEFELIEDNRGGKFRIDLKGNINKCSVVRPPFTVKSDKFEKWEKRYLPAKGLGFLIVSTSDGVMTHEEARKKGVGGRLIAYIY